MLLLERRRRYRPGSHPAEPYVSPVRSLPRAAVGTAEPPAPVVLAPPPLQTGGALNVAAAAGGGTDWEPVEDPDSGLVYWHNARTGATSFGDPLRPKALPPPPPPPPPGGIAAEGEAEEEQDYVTPMANGFSSELPRRDTCACPAPSSFPVCGHPLCLLRLASWCASRLRLCRRLPQRGT